MRIGQTALHIADDRHGTDFLTYQRAIRRFFSKRISTQCDVEDLVQESVARYIVANRRGTVEQPLGYIFRIAHNLLVDYARRNTVAAPIIAAPEEDVQVSVRANQEDALHLADLRQALDHALDELPEKCREAFILRRFHAMDTPAIADRLGVSHRMVQKYLIQAMEHLRQRLVSSEEAI